MSFFIDQVEILHNTLGGAKSEHARELLAKMAPDTRVCVLTTMANLSRRNKPPKLAIRTRSKKKPASTEPKVQFETYPFPNPHFPWFRS